MSNTGEAPLEYASGWDTYWQGMQRNPARAAGGTQEKELEAFWSSLFAEALPQPGSAVLELACGGGAVSRLAAEAQPESHFYCADISPSALQIARESLSDAHFTACDGNKLPFCDQRFDLVFSQFGVEYAGPAALLEAARMVAPGGLLALALHLQGGGIYRQYSRNLEVISALRATDILALARQAFSAGFDVIDGKSSMEAFKIVEARFKPAVRALEKILEGCGHAAADGLPGQLYRDIAHMYPRMRAYRRQDIASWLEAISCELDAYEGRLRSMLDCAQDEHDIDAFVLGCAAQGLQPVRREVLHMGAPASASGWILVLQRR